MHCRMVRMILVLTPSMILVSSAAWAQSGAQYDLRDFSGVWMRSGGHRSIHAEVPPMTALGAAMLEERTPARGRNLGEPLNGEHYSRVRAVVPAYSNDPMMQCNPQGFPRLLLDPEPVEFIHTGDERLLQFFQWERQIRELWTDGRQLPSGETLFNMGPAWYGYSVGEWEENTLVVNTVGFDERAWVDMFGMPYTFEARIEERYARVAADRIELEMTLYDPAVYAEPWVSDTKVFTRLPREDLVYFGWYGFSGGILEGICAPIDEVEQFNNRIRDPAGAGVGTGEQ